MNKEKIIKGSFWLLGFSTCIIISATCLFIGFNNLRHGDSTIVIVGLLFIPILFFCAFKGIKIILEAIFE